LPLSSSSPLFQRSPTLTWYVPVAGTRCDCQLIALQELQAEQSADLTGYEEGKSIWTNTKLMLAVMAQFCYVGAQVAVASQFISYAQHVAHLSAANASNRYAVGQGVFAIGRFASAGILLYVKPRYVLFVSSTAIIVFIILAMAIKGEAGLAMLTVVLFFESNQVCR